MQNCIHGNDAKLHERVNKLVDFDEVWTYIMKAINEVVHMVKPQKILFLVVDGVAPSAKIISREPSLSAKPRNPI